MEKNNGKTVFFSEVPDSVWEKIQPKITEIYSGEVEKYYTKFGEAYLRKHCPKDDDFYGLDSCIQRLPLVIKELTTGMYRCVVNKDESGFATLSDSGELLEVNFVDLHYDTLRDLFKMLEFLAQKPKYEQFYDYAYKLTGATIGANVLMNSSNLLAPAPVVNNLKGAMQLEDKLKKKYPI